MNPLFNMLTGAQNGPSQPFSAQMNNVPSAPMNGFQSVVERARSLMQGMQNPQQLISRMIPGLPNDIAGDPNQIIQWLQQTGRVSPQQMQAARQLAGMGG